MNHTFLPLFLLAEGLVLGVVAYVIFLKKRAKLSGWRRTRGVVVEVKERKKSGTATRHPVIRYQTGTGGEATFESRFGSATWKVKAGDRLDILVNPANPEDAEAVNFQAQWMLPLVLGIAAIGSLISAVVFFFFVK